MTAWQSMENRVTTVARTGIAQIALKFRVIRVITAYFLTALTDSRARRGKMSKQKDELIAQIPWVRLYKGKQKGCEGIKWKHVALKHLYSMGGREPEGIPDKARCKFRAKWHYTAPRPRKYQMTGRTGDYCIHHLFSIIYSYQPDYDRYRKWSKEQDAASTPSD